MLKNDTAPKIAGKNKSVAWWKGLSINFVLLLSVAALFVFSLFIGRYDTDPYTVILILVSGTLERIGEFVQPLASRLGTGTSLFRFIPHDWDPTMTPIIWNIRLPEALGVILVGAGLALSGASYQAVFRNPLVAPDILGVSTGAALGATLAILFTSDNSFVVPIVAFSFGIMTVAATYAISMVLKRDNPTLTLILGGIVIASLLSALISILISYAAEQTNGDPTRTKLQSIIFWFMGSFQGIKFDTLMYLAPIVIFCALVLLLLRWRLNVLSMGDEEARALGIDTARLRAIVIICSTMITALCVCVAGTIGWVGLAIPHFARMLVGPDHKVMMITSLLLGAAFMLVVDDICRDAFAALIPVNIVTSLIGVPIFLYLLRRSKQTWS